jgi:GcrA cell cycle regulator
MIWNAEKQLTLKTLWEKGFSGGQIAKILKTSRSAILGKARRMNLVGRRVDTSVQKKNPSKPNRIIHDNRHAMEALREGLCKFPIGDPGTVNFSFCFAPVFGRSVYCLEHKNLCYTPPKDSMGRSSKDRKSE